MLETINKTYVNDMLTLRYDRYGKSDILDRTNKDFMPTQSDVGGISTESILKHDIHDKLLNHDRICISLSSGVDSTLLLALVREVFPKKKITCINHIGQTDESKVAKSVANKFNAEFVSIPQTSIIKDIPRMIDITGEPRWNAYNLHVFEEAKKHGDILVTGDGADEIYAGYTFRYEKYMRGFTYLECHENDWVSDQEELISNFSWKDYDSFYIQDADIDPLTYVMMMDFNGKLLHDFIPTTLSMSKHHQLETYSPYLCERSIDIGTHLSIKEKYDDGVGKIPLRNISKRHGLELKKEKIPYSMNMLEDYNNNHMIVDEVILNPESDIYTSNLINFGWVKKHMKDQIKDYRIINKFLQLYCLQVWLNVH